MLSVLRSLRNYTNTIPQHQMNATTRRAFIGSSAALCMTSFGRAEKPSSLNIPAVDEVTLQVVVDNSTFGPFLPDQDLPGLKVVRNSGLSGPSLPRRPLLAEFGLSVLAESRLGPITKRVLVDFGYSPEVIQSNLSLLAINPMSLNASVLSHGHLDHYGGFSGVFNNVDRAERKLPLVVGGEEAFCERVAMIGSPPPLMGTLDREQLAKAGFDVFINPDPQLLGGHCFTTGLIPLVSSERAAMPTQMRPGVGCNPNDLSAAKRREKLIPDDGEHELATCLLVKNLGLIVIASCSHRGVVNSVRRAQEISGINKVHAAVIGGFHLVRPRTEAEARETVAEFAKINPAYIIPMHCTGEVFIAEAMKVMPQKIIRPYVGTKFVVTAA